MESRRFKALQWVPGFVWGLHRISGYFKNNSRELFKRFRVVVVGFKRALGRFHGDTMAFQGASTGFRVFMEGVTGVWENPGIFKRASRGFQRSIKAFQNFRRSSRRSRIHIGVPEKNLMSSKPFQDVAVSSGGFRGSCFKVSPKISLGMSGYYRGVSSGAAGEL